MLPAPTAIPSAQTESQSCAYSGRHESLWVFFFFFVKSSHTCDPFFRHPVSNEPHLQLPCLIFYHRSQHFFYGSCGLKLFQCSLTLCHCGKIIFSHEGKLKMDRCRSDRGKEHPRVLFLFNTMSFSYGDPVLVGIDRWPSTLAHITWFMWYNTLFISSLQMQLRRYDIFGD